jgi:GNAT superfamily N-acetyltransferase
VSAPDRGGVVDASSVLPVRTEEVERAGSVIARAFHEDPLNVHLYPDEETRVRLAPLMFAAIVRYDHLFGQVDHLSGFTAVASWLRPSPPAETPERLAQVGFEDLPDDVPLEVLDTVFGFVGPAVGNAVAEPHWHLRLLAVDTGHQGRGVGAVLLRNGLDRAAHTGHPVVLETFSERAVPFYLRNGFELVVDSVEPTSGLPFWAFRHMPPR